MSAIAFSAYLTMLIKIKYMCSATETSYGSILYLEWCKYEFEYII